MAFLNLTCGHMIGFTFGWIFLILFWVFIIWAILALVSALSGRKNNWHFMQGQEDEAIRIIRERYARGEINREEFEEKEKNLMARR